MWILGTELQSFGRSPSALNCQKITPHVRNEVVFTFGIIMIPVGTSRYMYLRGFNKETTKMAALFRGEVFFFNFYCEQDRENIQRHLEESRLGIKTNRQDLARAREGEIADNMEIARMNGCLGEGNHKELRKARILVWRFGLYNSYL